MAPIIFFFFLFLLLSLLLYSFLCLSESIFLNSRILVHPPTSRFVYSSLHHCFCKLSLFFISLTDFLHFVISLIYCLISVTWAAMRGYAQTELSQPWGAQTCIRKPTVVHLPNRHPVSPRLNSHSLPTPISFDLNSMARKVLGSLANCEPWS